MLPQQVQQIMQLNKVQNNDTSQMMKQPVSNARSPPNQLLANSNSAQDIYRSGPKPTSQMSSSINPNSKLICRNPPNNHSMSSSDSTASLLSTIIPQNINATSTETNNTKYSDDDVIYMGQKYAPSIYTNSSTETLCQSQPNVPLNTIMTIPNNHGIATDWTQSTYFDHGQPTVTTQCNGIQNSLNHVQIIQPPVMNSITDLLKIGIPAAYWNTHTSSQSVKQQRYNPINYNYPNISGNVPVMNRPQINFNANNLQNLSLSSLASLGESTINLIQSQDDKLIKLIQDTQRIPPQLIHNINPKLTDCEVKVMNDVITGQDISLNIFGNNWTEKNSNSITMFRVKFIKKSENNSNKAVAEMIENMIIGVVDHDNKTMGYVIQSDGICEREGDRLKYKYCASIKSGDVISVVVNGINGELSYIINNVFYGVRSRINPSKSWQLYFNFCGREYSAIIMDYGSIKASDMV